MADETQCGEWRKEDPIAAKRFWDGGEALKCLGARPGSIVPTYGLRRLDFWLGVLLLAATFVLSAAIPRLLPRYAVASIGGAPVKVDNWTGRINGLTTRITPPEAPAGQ